MAEEADDYPGVTAVLNDNWRVIECRSGIQWILQRRGGERHGRARWEGRSFCRTSEALKRVSRAFAGDIRPSAWSILQALPDWFPDKRPNPPASEPQKSEANQ
jgi:hypothetical protein